MRMVTRGFLGRNTPALNVKRSIRRKRCQQLQARRVPTTANLSCIHAATSAQLSRTDIRFWQHINTVMIGNVGHAALDVSVQGVSRSSWAEPLE
jgi:hypothetical protein